MKNPHLIKESFFAKFSTRIGPWGLLPTFIIIGAQRSGTSSLYHYLCNHLNIFPAKKKEIHFFDFQFQKGIRWYRSNFPAIYVEYYYEWLLRRKFITGEASPYYLFHPFAAHRIYKELPSVKLIIILRNPIDRAYSHYWHEVKRGHEKLSFEEAIDKEPERLSESAEDFLKSGYSFNHWKYSYLNRGKYLEQIKKWHSFFPREQVLIINSEDFYINTSFVLNRVCDFLSLQTFNDDPTRIYNKGKYPTIPSSTRKKLNRYFEPYNQALYDYLKKDYGWR